MINDRGHLGLPPSTSYELLKNTSVKGFQMLKWSLVTF